MRTANLALKFLLELAALGLLAAAGWRAGQGWTAVALGIAAPLAMVVVWGRWTAPRAAHRLPTPARIPLELGVFAIAAVLAFLTGLRVPATVFAGLVVVNAVAMTAYHQWDA